MKKKIWNLAMHKITTRLGPFIGFIVLAEKMAGKMVRKSKFYLANHDIEVNGRSVSREINRRMASLIWRGGFWMLGCSYIT